MVEQLSSFADEVTRVAREVGTEGILGGQAEVEDVSGTWRDLTESVNGMASNLTDQVRNIAQVTTAVALGDLSQKIEVQARGEILELKSTINTMVDQLRAFAAEVTRVAREVGTDGELGGQADVADVSGTWRDLTENVNSMAANLTSQVRSIAQVTTAVANGDLGQQITVDARGEILELKLTINTMVDQLSSFADEVTRVAREVGTEGVLGGQARVEGVSGTWRDLTESVNGMASNLTDQVRQIAEVTTAVAGGDLSRTITVEAKGEVAALAETINTMVEQLSSFAVEVTRVAREVGTEGILGGQAEVEDVSGTWRQLTESVNQLASNLTTQVRAMADVATSVTQGDLTRQIDVDASGEVAQLKDRVNEMIAELRTTTRENAEQDWLKTNLARITNALQGQRDLQAVAQLLMSEISPLVHAQHGAFFLAEEERLELVAGYGLARGRRRGRALRLRRGPPRAGRRGDAADPRHRRAAGLRARRQRAGRGAARRARRPAHPLRGPGPGRPRARLAGAVHRRRPDLPRPARRDDRRRALDDHRQRAHGGAAGRPAPPDRRAADPAGGAAPDERGAPGEGGAARPPEPRHRGQERGDRARPRGARGARRPARAVVALQERVPGQHEPRAAHAAELAAHPLAPAGRQPVGEPQRASRSSSPRTIHGAGTDLLDLISDILDLSKVEAGKMDVAPASIEVGSVLEALERAFRPVAEDKGLAFTVEVAPDAPAAIVTDEQRAGQVLRNLLSNAVKFTDAAGRCASRRARPPPPTRWPSSSPTPASGSPPTSRRWSSRPSSRPTGRRAAGTAARAWGCRSAAS